MNKNKIKQEKNNNIYNFDDSNNKRYIIIYNNYIYNYSSNIIHIRKKGLSFFNSSKYNVYI